MVSGAEPPAERQPWLPPLRARDELVLSSQGQISKSQRHRAFVWIIDVGLQLEYPPFGMLILPTFSFSIIIWEELFTP
jgi:hypothetical protein